MVAIQEIGNPAITEANIKIVGDLEETSATAIVEQSRIARTCRAEIDRIIDHFAD